MGTEAYSVAVKISLKDAVTKGLGLLSNAIKKTGQDADQLQKKLANIVKLGLAGLASYKVGKNLLGDFKPAIEAASDYAHQLNIMTMAGMSHLEVVNSINAAWKTTGTVITSTASSNLKTIMDLRNIFGNTNEAIAYTPELARIQTILGASGSGNISANSENLVYSLAKALDIRGAVNNPAQFNTQAEAMAKVIIATQGRVLPQDYQQLFKYGRQAIPGLSNEFLYQELPTFMQQMKGGSGSSGGFGVPLAAFGRFFVQGVMTKMAMGSMENLGLIPKNAGLKTSTVGTMLNNGTHVKGIELAQADPLKWVQDIMLPAIRKKYGDNLTNSQLSLLIADSMRGAPQTAIFATQQFALKAQQAYRDQHLIQRAMDPTKAYNMAISNDPKTVMTAASAQWENLKTQLGMTVIPILLPTIMVLAKGLSDLVQILEKYPTLTKTLGIGFLSLSAALTGVGAVLMTAAGGKAISIAFKLMGIEIGAAIAPVIEIVGIIAALGIACVAAYKAVKTLHDLYQSYVPGSHSDTGSKFVVSPGQKPVVVHSHLFLDSHQVATAVTKVQARQAMQQPAHGSFQNPGMSLPSNMNNQMGQ